MTTKKRKSRGLSPHVSLDNVSFDAPEEVVQPATEPAPMPGQTPSHAPYVGPEVDFDNGVHTSAEHHENVTPTPHVVARPSDGLSYGKIEEKEEAIRKHKEALEKSGLDKTSKNTEALTKTIQDLIKTLKGGPVSTSATPGSGPAPVLERNSKSLKETLMGAVAQSIKGKASPLTDLVSKKGLFGVGAAKFGADPNSLLGSVFGALHEREADKGDEKKRQKDFHTGFVTGTDTGRDLLAEKKRVALDAVKKENPKLTDAQANKKADQIADAESRKVTSRIYDAKKEKEDKLSALNAKQNALKAKGDTFDLSEADKFEQANLKSHISQLGSSGKYSESDLEVKARHTRGVMADIGHPVPGETPKEENARNDQLVAELKHISELSSRQLEYYRKTYDLMKASRDEHKADDAAKNTESQIAEMDKKEKTPTGPGIFEKVKENSEKKPILGKGKDILGKGKGMLEKVGGLMEEGGLLKSAGKWIGGALGTVGTALGGIGAGTLAAGGAAALGVAGAGQALIGKDGVLRGGGGHNFISNAVGADNWFDSDKAEDAAQSMTKAVPVSPKRIAELKAANMAKSRPVAMPEPVVAEKLARDVKPAIDEKAAGLEKARGDKPIVLSQPIVSTPIVNNNSSTTQIVRAPLRNQEPSFNETLKKNFV